MRKALVVDDESDARTFVRAILEPLGWEIAEAEEGESGLVKAKSIQPELIVLDVQMPGKSGFQVFGDLVKDPATKDCKIVMLTGVAEKTGIGFSADEMGEFLGREPDAYVEKPIDPDTFKQVLDKVIPAE